MNERQCKECQHFMQHYVFNKRKIFRVYCGHCTFAGARRKLPDASVCENFVPGPDDTDAFVTKEYLSKELLQYVLSLELVPGIEEAPVPAKKKRRG